jgi:hypothetical protein
MELGFGKIQPEDKMKPNLFESIGIIIVIIIILYLLIFQLKIVLLTICFSLVVSFLLTIWMLREIFLDWIEEKK